MEITCKYFGFYYNVSRVDDMSNLVYLQIENSEIPVRAKDVHFEFGNAFKFENKGTVFNATLINDAYYLIEWDAIGNRSGGTVSYDMLQVYKALSNGDWTIIKNHV